MNRLFVCAVALLALGCSGTDPGQLFDDSGTGPVDSGSPDAVVQQDASAPNDATSPNDAAMAMDVQAADVTPDTYVGPPDSKIQCGPSLTCSAQAQACCWHQGSNTKPYECVSGPSSCAGVTDVLVTCSTNDNCASQGNPSYTCCATGGNFGTGTCSGADIATVVACKSSCTDIEDYQVGCSVTLQNCSDTTGLASSASAPTRARRRSE